MAAGPLEEEEDTCLDGATTTSLRRGGMEPPTDKFAVTAARGERDGTFFSKLMILDGKLIRFVGFFLGWAGAVNKCSRETRKHQPSVPF